MNKRTRQQLNKNGIDKNKSVEGKKKIEKSNLIERFFIRIDNIDTRNYNEAVLAVRDFINLKGGIIEGEILNLSEVCDMFFNLKYTGKKLNKDRKELLFFSIC